MGGETQERSGGDGARAGAGRQRALASLAGRQHGVVAQRQLEELGYTRRMIERRLAVRFLHPIHRGVYAVGHPRLSKKGRWLAAVLACGPGAVLSHRSAAALWGLRRSAGHSVDVTSTHGRAGRPGIASHECKLDPEDVVLIDAIPVTTAARTLFDLAEADPHRVQRAFEEADRLRILEMAALERVVERGWGRHALRPIRPLLTNPLYAEATRSLLEDRFVAFCVQHRLPPPATNVILLGHEVDALWPEQRLVVELDGFAFHAHRAAFERDRARDAALQAAGFRVIRLTHRRLTDDPGGVAAELRTCLNLTTHEGA